MASCSGRKALIGALESDRRCLFEVVVIIKRPYSDDEIPVRAKRVAITVLVGVFDLTGRDSVRGRPRPANDVRRMLIVAALSL